MTVVVEARNRQLLLAGGASWRYGPREPFGDTTSFFGFAKPLKGDRAETQRFLELMGFHGDILTFKHSLYICFDRFIFVLSLYNYMSIDSSVYLYSCRIDQQ